MSQRLASEPKGFLPFWKLLAGTDDYRVMLHPRASWAIEVARGGAFSG